MLIAASVGLAPAGGAAATQAGSGRGVVVATVASSDGVTLPVAYRDDPPESTAFGGPDFAISPVTTLEGTDRPFRDVIRLSDGAVVRTVPASSLSALPGSPSIVDNKLITRAKVGQTTTVTVEDLVSGATHQYTLPQFDTAITRPDWAVTTVGSTLYLHRADGTSSLIAGPYGYCTAVNLIDVDDEGVLFGPSCTDLGGFLLTVATGEVDPVPDWYLTPHRVFSLDPKSTGWEVTWATRESPADRHTVPIVLHGDSWFVTYGDELLVKETRPCVDGRCGAELREVNLETGALGDVLASHVVATSARPDGSLMVTVDDGDTGELVLLRRGEAPHRVAALPRQPVQPFELGFANGRVVTVSREVAHNPVREYVDGAWGTVTDPMTGTTLFHDDESYNNDMQVATDSIAIKQADWSQRLVWPGGGRVLDIGVSSFELGHGGKLVTYQRFEGAGTWHGEVQDLRSGEVLWERTAANVPNVALDGTWFWRVVDQRTLEGIDTSGQAPVRRFDLGPACAAHESTFLDVRGRWALVGCPHGLVVFDLDDVVTPYLLPATRSQGHWRLGNGFVYERSVAPYDSIKVTSLDVGHETRYVGTGVAGVVDDDAGAHALVWTDAFGRFHRVDLDWLTVPTLGPDQTAPRLVATTGSARYVRGGGVPGSTVALTFGWRYDDPVVAHEGGPAGVASYDVRVRALSPTGRWSAWSMIRSATTQRSLRRSYADEWTACFQVRARDLAGNLSAWSTNRCTSVDGRNPVITRAAIDTSRLRTLGFVFHASDHFGISHYVVRYRRGPNTAPWIAPSKWRHLEATSVSLGRDGRRTCLEVTAVDRVGHRDRVVRCVRR